MSVNLTDGVAVVNSVREMLSPLMQASIPVANIDNIGEVGAPILQWSELANAFYTNLTNLIGMTYVEYRTWQNPLSMFKRGDQVLGDGIREIAINFTDEEDYNVAGTDLLNTKKPDLKVCYHRVNRQKKFSVTNIEAELEMAFTSWDNFGTLVSRIVENLYRSNEVAEYQWTKATILSAINDEAIPSVEATFPEDEASGKAFTKAVRALSEKFTFPSTSYNAYNKSTASDKNFATFTPKDQQVLIITPEALASLDVDVLAVAFHMDKAEFLGRVVVMDDLGTESNAPFAMLCDSAFVKIWEKKRYFNSFLNPDNMSLKSYLHVWQTYGYSPFANAVVFKPAVNA